MDREKSQNALITIEGIWEFVDCGQEGASDVEALNILWKIVPKSQETIGILRLTVEGGPQHHCRLKIEVEVEGARASTKDEEAQCQRQ